MSGDTSLTTMSIVPLRTSSARITSSGTTFMIRPSFFGAPTILSLVGHSTVVPEPISCLKVGLMAERCLVNTKFVPLASDRRTTVIGRSGSLAPGLAAAILGSFQFVILPRKIPAIVEPSRWRLLGTFGML